MGVRGDIMGRETREEARPGQEPDSKKESKAQKKKARKQRVPLGRHRAKLAVSPDLIPRNKVGRWVNDHPGRLQQAEAGGYAFVEDPHAKVGEGTDRRDRLSTKISCLAGTREDNSPLRAYLMVIDKDLYDQDQKDKQGHVDEIDKAIKEGTIASEDSDDVEHRYIPDKGAGIRYKP